MTVQESPGDCDLFDLPRDDLNIPRKQIARSFNSDHQSRARRFSLRAFRFLCPESPIRPTLALHLCAARREIKITYGLFAVLVSFKTSVINHHWRERGARPPLLATPTAGASLRVVYLCLVSDRLAIGVHMNREWLAAQDAAHHPSPLPPCRAVTVM